MITRTLRAAAACALLATTCLVSPVFAQTSSSGAPAYRNLDANGVDLTRGDFVMSLVEGSIGSGEGELALVRDGAWYSGYNGHRWDSISLNQWSNTRSVSFGQTAEYFTGTTSQQGNGSTLTLTSGGYVHRAADGTTISFRPKDPNCSPTTTQSCTWLPEAISAPDGKTVNLGWEEWLVCPDVPIGSETSCTVDSIRLGGVSNDDGYSIDFTYAADGSGGPQGPSPEWFRRTQANFHNNVTGSSPQGTVRYAYPAVGVTEVTDMAGRVWRITGSATIISAIRRPGAAADTTTISRSAGIVTSVTREGVTTNYNRTVSGNSATTTVTNALNQQTVVVSDLTIGRPVSVTDALGRTTSFAYDASGRAVRTTAPEGNYVQSTYDARGNVVRTDAVAKPGSGAPTVTGLASFAPDCANPVTCNSPISTTDARGNVTDYGYDPVHGGVLSVTAPAAANGVRPQMRYAYTQTNGASGAAKYRLTSTSTCQAGASCAGTADEVTTTLAYDANSNVTSTSTGAGDGSLTATRAMTYDAVGNLLTVDGPLPGPADTVRARYNAGRERVGTVSPDPDGAGPMKPRAVRTAIDTRGLVTRQESGTVADASDAAWAAFAPAEAVEIGYDAAARPVTSRLVGGGATHALTQTSYDALGRADCTAQRMNPTAFFALPASACSLGAAGSFGPDRIARTVYDAAGQAVKVQTAFGTAEQADEATSTYRPNGQVETLTDGEGNRTTYEYDGQDRLAKTIYPSPTKGANASNGADYEQLGYDAGSNVTSHRLRDGNVIGYSYDALGRLVFKDLPNIALHEHDISYAYDNLGRLKSANDPYYQISHSYDALGRHTAESSNLFGTMASQYDIAGRRTRLTHPDGFFVTYDYLVTGEQTAIQENGVTSGIGVLATFGYDDLGRRTSLMRGNGRSTSYAYDPTSRLQTLTQNLGGGASDLTLGFSYNPASQIVASTRSNDAFAWTGHGSGSTASAANGLNQLVSQGGVSLSYDGRGNLTNDGVKTFGYTSENRLASASGVALAYDPLGRMHYVNGAATLQYDGGDLIAELGAGNAVARRYVHGPGTDEPLVWYEGSGTADRRFLHADERGSIVAVSNSAGAVTNVNTYDEYGKPGSGNVGRFQYTGQKWIGEIGLYDYKARMYHPELGRFLQTDPIEYEAGMNLYGYVGADPVNLIDPSGLKPKKANGPSDTIIVTDTRGGGGGIAVSGGAALLNARLRPGGVPDADSVSIVDAVIDNVEEIVVTARRSTARVAARIPAILRIIGSGPGRVLQTIVDNVVGYPLADGTLHNEGAKAPGKPGPKDGFKEPKRGKPTRGRAPDGRYGWIDRGGKVWVPTGPAGSPGAHGGPHWDVEDPRGGYENIYPGGKSR